jgi:hypothetical protein
VTEAVLSAIVAEEEGWSDGEVGLLNAVVPWWRSVK